jgi:acyl carrier protein
MVSDPATLATELCTYLRERVLDRNVPISPATPFAEAGIDSMSIIELVMYLERRHGIALPDDALRKEHLRSAEALAECAVAVQAGTFQRQA